MTIDVRPEGTAPLTVEADVEQLVADLRPRLADAVGPADVDRLIREALDDLGPVRVTTYLSILVERRVRERVRKAQTVDVREAPVTV